MSWGGRLAGPAGRPPPRSPRYLDQVQGELRDWGGVHELLQVLAEELKDQIQLLLVVHHAQQPGRGRRSGCGSQGAWHRPGFPASFPTSPDDVGVPKLFEQGDLPDGGAWDPLGLPAGREGTAVEAGSQEGCFCSGGESPVFHIPSGRPIPRRWAPQSTLIPTRGPRQSLGWPPGGSWAAFG